MRRLLTLLSFVLGRTPKNADVRKDVMQSFSEQELDLTSIQPMIVPSTYLKNGWDLPHLRLPNQQFIVCWVRNYATSNSYILREEYRQLEIDQKEWQKIAVENLRNAAHFYQYSQTNDQGKLLWIAFINEEDAVSSSKVLLVPDLSALFPEGYEVGIPNRVVGFAISKECPLKEKKKVLKKIKAMYAMHGSAMSKELFDSADFRLPTHLY